MIRSIAAGAAFALAAGAFAASAAPAAAPPTAGEAIRLEMRIEARTAPIQDRAQFEAYVAANPSPRANPFRLLSADAQRRFVASLDFDAIRRGTAVPQAADIEAELTLSQAWRLLALVGQQWEVVMMPDIRVETDDDRLVDDWRKLFERVE